MRIAFLGCGYVANMYRLSLPLHPALSVAGAFDLDTDRAQKMVAETGGRVYASFDELLEDDDCDLVMNLTSPLAHYETTKACLEAGKHVYTEKPLAMEMALAKELVAVAEAKGVHLTSAPCTLMSEAAQTLWKAVRDKRVGEPRLVYAEMEDGMVHRMPVTKWINEMGVPWPYVNEFETGCTVEHAGYVLSWLVAIFGPAELVSAFSTTLVPEKLEGVEINGVDDWSVGCIRFRSGVTARLTCGIYAPHDHRLRVFGDEGTLDLEDPRSDDSNIAIRKYITFRRGRKLSPLKKKVPLLGKKVKHSKHKGSQRRDFLRSVADIAAAVEEGRKPYLTADYSLHVNEITLALQNASDSQTTQRMTTTCETPKPLPWAR